MENKFKDRDISFETLEKAVNGDYFAMQEVIRLFKPDMATLRRYFSPYYLQHHAKQK